MKIRTLTSYEYDNERVFSLSVDLETARLLSAMMLNQAKEALENDMPQTAMDLLISRAELEEEIKKTEAQDE